MSDKFTTGGTDLRNKFSMISQPLRISNFADEDEGGDGDEDETANYRWLARSRRLQARRWREIKRQEA